MSSHRAVLNPGGGNRGRFRGSSTHTPTVLLERKGWGGPGRSDGSRPVLSWAAAFLLGGVGYVLWLLAQQPAVALERVAAVVTLAVGFGAMVLGMERGR